jgi:hypothetical protein
MIGQKEKMTGKRKKYAMLNYICAINCFGKMQTLRRLTCQYMFLGLKDHHEKCRTTEPTLSIQRPEDKVKCQSTKGSTQ